jgi:hypothetical protein
MALQAWRYAGNTTAIRCVYRKRLRALLNVALNDTRTINKS